MILHWGPADSGPWVPFPNPPAGSHSWDQGGAVMLIGDGWHPAPLPGRAAFSWGTFPPGRTCKLGPPHYLLQTPTVLRAGDTQACTPGFLLVCVCVCVCVSCLVVSDSLQPHRP